MGYFTWDNASILDELHVSPKLRTWLSLQTSMTKRMQDNCKVVNVSVVHNQLELVYPDEVTKLGIDPQCPCWVREVIMSCNDNPWLYGRTIIPECSLEGRVKELTQIGSIPLGRLLFSDPKTQRDAFEFAHICPDELYHKRMQNFARHVTQKLWARRSVFSYDKKPLLLTELFLPEMAKAIDTD